MLHDRVRRDDRRERLGQLPLFDGGHPGEIITTLVSNGAWGFGTALFLLVLSFATVKLSPLSLT